MRLRLIFGEYWNRECEERLKTIKREAVVEKYNRISEWNEKDSEYEKLLEKLELIDRYVTCRINRDNLQLSDEPIAPIMKLFSSILSSRTVEEELNPYVADGFDRYCTQFTREWDTEYDPLTAADDRIYDIRKKIYLENQNWLERRNEKLKAMKRVPEDSKALIEFRDKITKVRNLLEKKYSRFYDDMMRIHSLQSVQSFKIISRVKFSSKLHNFRRLTKRTEHRRRILHIHKNSSFAFLVSQTGARHSRSAA